MILLSGKYARKNRRNKISFTIHKYCWILGQILTVTNSVQSGHHLSTLSHSADGVQVLRYDCDNLWLITMSVAMIHFFPAAQRSTFKQTLPSLWLLMDLFPCPALIKISSARDQVCLSNCPTMHCNDGEVLKTMMMPTGNYNDEHKWKWLLKKLTRGYKALFYFCQPIHFGVHMDFSSISHHISLPRFSNYHPRPRYNMRRQLILPQASLLQLWDFFDVWSSRLHGKSSLWWW